jgi:hypothetical protein
MVVRKMVVGSVVGLVVDSVVGFIVGDKVSSTTGIMEGELVARMTGAGVRGTGAATGAAKRLAIGACVSIRSTCSS